MVGASHFGTGGQQARQSESQSQTGRAKRLIWNRLITENGGKKSGRRVISSGLLATASLSKSAARIIWGFARFMRKKHPRFMSIRQSSFFTALDVRLVETFSGSLKSLRERRLGKRSGFWVIRRGFRSLPETGRIAGRRVSRFFGKRSRFIERAFLLPEPNRLGSTFMKHAG